jgi:circadian clock protein KaiB
MMSKSKTLASEPNSSRKAGNGTGVETSRHLLRLYITGTTAGSTRAIQQVRKVCEEHLHGRYDLEVIDIYQLPSLAKHDQIIATPTLIKVLPAPLRRLIGDLSDVTRVLFGMDIREQG